MNLNKKKRDREMKAYLNCRVECKHFTGTDCNRMRVRKFLHSKLDYSLQCFLSDDNRTFTSPFL